MDPASEEAKEVAHKSLADRNTKSNSAYHDMLIKIVEASSQVVSGMNYKLIAYIGPSKCAKKDVKPEDVHSKCQLNDGNSAEKCTIKVYEQPWTNTFEVTEFSCKPATRREALKA
ncbi:Cystatin domain containing protein [Trichuris trichiura]|uniref:Cystatin domain containing protein n=1 Tax=Trichuris trichiura TaxID=36087 RepID=A0A077Z143_TRITR|nr:Cystatin domain containing protein [Trichuris trichiura]